MNQPFFIAKPIGPVEDPTKTLRDLICSSDLSFLMEAHDGLSAAIAKQVGFKGLWASGLSISSALGYRDASEASWTELVDVVERVADASGLPVLVDGDSGFGNFNNARLLAMKLLKHGGAGVCLEDKSFPKINSFVGDHHRLADIVEFSGRLKAVKDTTGNDLVLVARTEALIAGFGLGEALKRADAYAGADANGAHSASLRRTLGQCTRAWRSYQLSKARPRDLALVLVGRGRRDSRCVGQLSAPVVNRWSGANTGARDRRATLYTLRQINELRAYLASARPKDALKFYPRRREGEKLQIISVASGPAKTTTAFYLVQGLALQGFRVLAVDLDPQSSLSEMFGYFSSFTPYLNSSIYAAIRDDEYRASISTAIQPTHFDGLHLLPGSFELRQFERDCSRRYHSEGLKYPDASARMVSAIKEVEADYDIVVIHCAPEYCFLTVGAFEAATGVLVTVGPQLADIASMAMFLNIFSVSVSKLEEGGRSINYDFIKFLVTRHNPRDVSEQDAVALLRDSLGDDLLTATVWESDAIQKAGLKKRSLYDLSAGEVGRSAYEQAMVTLNSANAEVMDIISKVWGRPPIYVSQASRSTTAGKAKSQSRRLSK